MFRVICDRYEIQQPLSRKAGRQTLLAHDRVAQEPVVVKILTFDAEFEWEALKLFEREIQVLKTLSHPRVPRYVDSFELAETDGKGFVLVQSYIAAPSLESHLKAGRRFSEAEIQQVAESLLDILIYLQNQSPPVIHRDIKPSNVLLTDRSGNFAGQVYLVDFGSVQTTASSPGSTFTVVGTYGYMPPEQFSGRVTPASDLYSLGATLIYLATGQHPADLMTDNLQLKLPLSVTLSPNLARWLHQLVQPIPTKRFASAATALQALREPPSVKNPDLLDPPVGSKVILQHRSNGLWIKLPHGYLTSPDRITYIQLMATVPLVLVLIAMIFTVSPWHIVSLLVLFGAVDTVTKARSYEILINDQSIQIRALLSNIVLQTLNYRRDDIQRPGFGGDPKLSALRLDTIQYRLAFDIGAKPYQIKASNIVEATWLAQELIRGLGLPLMLLPRDAPSNDTETAASHQLLPPSSDGQTPQDTSPTNPITKPVNSRSEIHQTEDELEVVIPPRELPPGSFFVGLFYVTLASIFVGILVSYLTEASEQSTLGSLLFLLIILLMTSPLLIGGGYMILESQWGGTRLRITPRKVALVREFLVWKRTCWTTDRSQAMKLESHIKPLNFLNFPGDNSARAVNPSHVTLWVGTRKFRVSTSQDGLRPVELHWLAQELSRRLDLPIT
jgi:serine/threonine protein kinase